MAGMQPQNIDSGCRIFVGYDEVEQKGSVPLEGEQRLRDFSSETYLSQDRAWFHLLARAERLEHDV